MTRRRLEGKSGFITGAGRGIGRAVAVAMAREGARGLVLFSRTPSELEETARIVETFGCTPLVSPGDVRRASDLERAAKEGASRFGVLNFVVADAGAYIYSRNLVECTPEEWDEAMDINLKGAFLAVRATYPYLDREGSIVFVTTGLARGPRRFGAAREDHGSDPDGPIPGYAPYSLAKYALEGLTRVLSAELPQRVNAVNPGVVDTRMSPGAPLKPEDVVEVFLYLCSSESKGVTGRVLRAMDFLPS